MITTSAEAKTAQSSPKRDAFESKLSEGRQRLLAHAVDYALQTGRRTADDFIRHFSPAVIMSGLREQPQLRANIMVIATGVRSKIALKKSAESCGNDLQIAMDEGEADADTVVTLFDPDDRVRYLDGKALWQFVIEGSFWQADREKDRPRHASAAEYVAYIVDRALRDRLLTHRDVVDGITVAKLAELLPRTELQKVLTAVLKTGRDNKPYTDQHLLGAAPMSALVEYVPLPWIWDQVVIPRIAEAHAYVAKNGEPAAVAPVAAASTTAPGFVVPGPGPMPPESTPPPAAPAGDLDIAVDDILGSLDATPGKKGKERPAGSVPS